MLCRCTVYYVLTAAAAAAAAVVTSAVDAAAIDIIFNRIFYHTAQCNSINEIFTHHSP